MNINDALEQGPSITEINRALELFTDRIPERRLFASYLNDPARKSILFFHGDGGNGKSWLLRMLQARYCRHLSAKSWDFVKSQATDDDFVLHFEGAADFKPVPYAYLDFVDAHNNLGNTLQSLADLQAKLSQRDKAQDNYRQSIDCYDRALKWAPDHPVILRNREIALQQLSDLQGNSADKK